MPLWRSSRALFSALLLCTVLHAPGVSAAPGDENWDTAFGVPGVDGFVESSALFNGDLVVGGTFIAVGGVSITNLARLQGATWAGMGAPFDGGVSALVVWNSELYAGGDFTGGLARWNGSQWVIVGGGVDGTVSSLTVFASQLIVGGNFESVNGGATSTGGIASWNGTAWGTLGGGTSGSVADVEVFSGSLYACGSFDIAGGTLAYNLARWSGTSWFSVGGGLKDDTGDPYNAYGTSLVASGTRLYVGGSFLRAGSLAADGVVAWTGSAFATLGTPSFGGLAFGLGTFGADVVAGDSYGNIKRWNGTFWSALGITNAGFVSSFVEQGGALIAGGGFTAIGGTPVSSLARYNGT